MHKIGKVDFDLPSHCLGILADLWEKDGVIQKDLAISIVKDKATIARALDLMERKNIIVRIKGELDKRNKKIFLTHKGHALQKKIMTHANKLVNEIESNVSKEEMNACLNVLNKVYHKLKNKL